MNVMSLSSNIQGMISAQTQFNNSAQTIADVANTIGDPEFQGVTQDIVNAIAGQIPQTISYQANAKGIETQQAVVDTLLNIKA